MIDPKQEITDENNNHDIAVEENQENNSEELEQLKRELAEAQEKAQENRDKMLRATAEVENIRRRATKDVENAHKYGLEKFAKDLINVVDSLEHGLAAAKLTADNQGLKTIYEGMELTHKLLIDTLAKFGVTQSNPLGEKFDPNQHEALSMQESTEYPADHVMLVAQKGFMQYERVLRPARVIIAKQG